MIPMADQLSGVATATNSVTTERCALRFPVPLLIVLWSALSTNRTYSTYRICTTRSNGIPCMPPPHPIIPSKFQPTRCLFLHLSVSSSVLFAEALKIQDLRRTEQRHAKCAQFIHYSERSVVNISGKSIPSPPPPPRILLSEDLLLLSSMIGLSHTGPSSAKIACSNGHLEAGLGTLPREINGFSGLPRFDR